jgi:hypothetical protein
VADVGRETWSLVTFLAVPIIAFEGLSPIATLKRSASLFRERWGEQMGGNISISLVFFLVSLPAAALVVAGVVGVAGGGSSLVGWALAIVGLLALAVIAIAGRAASATFGAILYGYATHGETPTTIPRAELENLARPALTALKPLGPSPLHPELRRDSRTRTRRVGSCVQTSRDHRMEGGGTCRRRTGPTSS